MRKEGDDEESPKHHHRCKSAYFEVKGKNEGECLVERELLLVVRDMVYWTEFDYEGENEEKLQSIGTLPLVED